jgi:hypothetical protein
MSRRRAISLLVSPARMQSSTCSSRGVSSTAGASSSAANAGGALDAPKPMSPASPSMAASG